MNLTKFQISAVKSMQRSVEVLQKKLDRVNEREAAFLKKLAPEKEALQAEIDNANESILLYTGGLTAQEVLQPGTVVTETTPEGTVDSTATVDMSEILPATTEEAPVEVPAEEDTTEKDDVVPTDFENELAQSPFGANGMVAE